MDCIQTAHRVRHPVRRVLLGQTPEIILVPNIVTKPVQLRTNPVRRFKPGRAFEYLDVSEFTGPIIDVLKQKSMYGLQMLGIEPAGNAGTAKL